MKHIFNRNLQFQRYDRNRHRQHHPLHKELHDILHDRLSYIHRQFTSILIIGDFDYQSKTPNQTIIRCNELITALSEHLPFRANSFDLIISYMDLHHANDIPGILAQINYCLKPDGLFLGTFVGGQSLWRLRAACQQAEEKTLGGYSPRVAPMISVQDMAALAQRAGFAIPVIDHELFTLADDSLVKLLKQLQTLHLTNSLYDGFKGLTGKSFFKELNRFYPGLELDLDVLFVSGWAPAPNQQKPLPRGSGQFNLANVLG